MMHAHVHAHMCRLRRKNKSSPHTCDALFGIFGVRPRVHNLRNFVKVGDAAGVQDSRIVVGGHYPAVNELLLEVSHVLVLRVLI